MKNLTLIFITSICCLSAQADTITLFDGKTLDGWEGDKRFWKVQDGAITGQSTAELPCKQTTYLTYSKKEFANFELTVSFRFLTDKGNSGVQYRSQWHDKKKFMIKGYQADMETGPNYSGILYDQNGRGIVAKRGQEIVISKEGKKNIAPKPIKDANKGIAEMKKGKWSTYRIVADGHTLTHQINGFTTVEVEDNDVNRRDAKGLLALQLHQGAPMTVQYKDIKMLELPDSKKVEKVEIAKPKSPPEWIWSAKATDNQTLVFQKDFQVKGRPTQCALVVSCDNASIVWVNGVKVATTSDWKVPAIVDVVDHLKRGKNSIKIQARNEGSVAGLIVQLSNILVSDTSWLCMDTEKNPVKVVSLGKNGVKPWGNVLSGDLTLPVEETLTVADGFKVEKLYSVDKKTEGSWVSMCFDDTGYLYVSDQYGSLFKITLKGGEITSKKRIENMGHAQGLCWAYGSLYVASSMPKTPGVYRLTDSNKDGKFDKRELILPIKGGGEHGTHSLIKSPDGDGIHFIVGNHTKPPKDSITKFKKNWAEDTLHPHFNDASGHAVGVKAPGGTLIKLSADGKKREVVALGLRNTYDIAASPSGSIFGYDADMEYDIGTPWYRPTRVVHLVAGADFGWRTGTAKWPDYYADSLGSVIDIGPGCPTGVVFGTGAKFPAKYQKALFILDWTFGKIYAVHLSPDGSSYTGKKEVFVSGKPLPVTDAVIGPDGAMYFLTGGRRLRSGLYRVSYTGDGNTATLPPEKPSDAQLKFEKIQESTDVEELWNTLSSGDRMLRYAARVSLENLDVKSWQKHFEMAGSPQHIITASLALSRNKADAKVIFKKLLEIDFTKLTEAQKLEYLRAVSLACIRRGAPEKEMKDAFLSKLDSQYPSANPMLNRELCRLLVYLESTQVLGKTVFLMQSSVVVKEDISDDLLKGNYRYGKDFKNMLKNQPDSQALHYALMLKNQKQGWTEAAVRGYYQWLAKAEMKSGGNSYKGFIRNIRKEAMTHLKPDLLVIAKQASKIDTTTKPIALAKGPGRSWSLEESTEVVKDLSKANIANGKKMFQATLCARCHMHSKEGGSAGPDLTNLANRFEKKDILKAIIDPSEVISDQYVTTVFHLKGGTTLQGKLMKEDDTHLHIATNPFDLSEQTPVLKSTITKRTQSTVSTMPPSLINALNPDELRDLMLYLTTQPK